MIYAPEAIAAYTPGGEPANQSAIMWRLPYGVYINTGRLPYGTHLNVEPTSLANRVLVISEPTALLETRHYEVRGVKTGVSILGSGSNAAGFHYTFGVCSLCKLIDNNTNIHNGICNECTELLDTGTCTACEDSFLMVNGEYIDLTINENRIVVPMNHNCNVTACVECGNTKWAIYEQGGKTVARYIRVVNSVPMPQWIRERLYYAVCTECREKYLDQYEQYRCVACYDVIIDAYNDLSRDLCAVDAVNKEYMCCECERRENEKSIIFPYGYKPTPIFRLPEKKTTKYVNSVNNLFIGMELEVELKRDVNRREFTAYVTNLLNDGASVPFAYVKNDGSLLHGVEIVTDPGDFGWWEKEFPMHLFSRRGKAEHPELNGIRTSARTAGMHLHLSKSSFNPSTMYNFIMFHKYMRPTIVGMAGRQPNNYCRYSMDTWSQSEIENYAYGRRIIRLASTRYLGLNLSPNNTVELRYFKSKADEKFLRESVEFAHSMWNFSKTIPISIWDVNQGTPYPVGAVRYEVSNTYKEFVLSNSDRYPVLSEVLPSVIVS